MACRWAQWRPAALPALAGIPPPYRRECPYAVFRQHVINMGCGQCHGASHWLDTHHFIGTINDRKPSAAIIPSAALIRPPHGRQLRLDRAKFAK